MECCRRSLQRWATEAAEHRKVLRCFAPSGEYYGRFVEDVEAGLFEDSFQASIKRFWTADS